jgi:hypothetical protein
MYGQIHTALCKRFLNFLGEHPFGSNLRKGNFLQPVASGLDDLDLD